MIEKHFDVSCTPEAVDLKKKRKQQASIEKSSKVIKGKRLGVGAWKRSKYVHDQSIALQSKIGKHVDNRKFVTQCRPQGLYSLLQQLNDKQKDAVESIGFGGLLKMSVSSLPSRMVDWLVKRFNGRSRMLKIDDHKSFVITPDDICDIFQLPRHGGRKVLVLKRSNNLDIVEELKKKYNIDGKSSVADLKNLLMNGFKDGGDDFKRFFVLYSLSTLLTPTANRTVDVSTLKSLVNVNEISQFDWCSYVLERLCRACDNYNEKLMGNISGCVLVLQIVYFHRLKFHGKAEPSVLPLIQHWTTEKIHNRISLEREAGEFGQGEWVDSVYPISFKSSAEFEQKIQHPGAEKMGDKVSLEDIGASSRFIKFALPEGQLTDSEVHELAKNDLHKTFLLLKRDIAVVSEFHMNKLLKIKEKIEHQQPCVMSSESLKVQKFIDDVVDKLTCMKKITEEMLAFELFTPEKQQSLQEEDVNEDDNNDGIEEAIASVGSRSQNEAKELYDCVSSGAWAVGEEAGYVSSFMNSNKKLMVHMDIRDMHVVDFCLFDVEPYFESDLVFSHDDIFTISKKEMLSLNQERRIFTSVVDAWVLILNRAEAGDDTCKRVFFDTAHSYFLAQIMNGETVVPDKERSMRTCWEGFMLYVKYDLSAYDMIFIPIHLNSHFFCAVLNFRDEKIKILDNRKYDDPSYYIGAVRVVQNQMAIFLQENNHPKAGAIRQYPIEYFDFSWQSEKETSDCGVFLMHHMEHFKGEIYPTPDDLKEVSVRDVLRAKICLRILLSDLNNLRFNVMKKVGDFCIKKSSLKTDIKEEEANLKKKDLCLCVRGDEESSHDIIGERY